MPITRNLRNRLAAVVMLVLWIPAVGLGVRTLLRYSNTPGRPAAPPARWPSASPFRPARGRAALLIFAHPQCPCSRATIGELALIVAKSRTKVDVSVFFYSPPAEASGWAMTDLWRSATAIPGVRAIEDPGGLAARRFGASTSGQALLYDPGGRLLFSGGITASRGHSGDNEGRDAILALLGGEAVRRNTTPVFGCSLLGAQ